MPIPCPTHNPKGWSLYQEMHGPRVDWVREAEIARMCCSDCHDAALQPGAAREGENDGR